MTITHLRRLLVGTVEPNTGSTCTGSSEPGLDEDWFESPIADRMQFGNRPYVNAICDLAAFRIGFP